MKNILCEMLQADLVVTLSYFVQGVQNGFLFKKEKKGLNTLTKKAQR